VTHLLPPLSQIDLPRTLTINALEPPFLSPSLFSERRWRQSGLIRVLRYSHCKRLASRFFWVECLFFFFAMGQPGFSPLPLVSPVSDNLEIPVPLICRPFFSAVRIADVVQTENDPRPDCQVKVFFPSLSFPFILILPFFLPVESCADQLSNLEPPLPNQFFPFLGKSAATHPSLLPAEGKSSIVSPPPPPRVVCRI